ncbi:hypothetical protein AB0I55_29295 [Actinocatenispora sera]|uniref:hypothetical protein n=1 Tax=Actinocatenispora sera TaxID=390989 RepID=UPI00340CC6CB
MTSQPLPHHQLTAPAPTEPARPAALDQPAPTGPPAYRTDRCRSCNSPIWWARTPAGRSMPVDAVPSPTGTLQLHRTAHQLLADVVPAEQRPDAGPLYLSHFATCPSAWSWRSGGRRG